ncbi:MAG: Uma2 family endonuclease [Actinoallomurus sp.]
MAVPLEVDLPSDHYTVEDWLHLPETVGQRVELIDGSFVVSPTPLANHQVCAKQLVRILDDAAPPDLEVVEAFGVRTANEVLVPDVVVADVNVLRSTAAVLLPEQTHLVAEIVSPGNRRRDYHDKPRIYAEIGVPTFLRVELTAIGAPYVEVLHLHDGAYALVGKVSAGQTLEITDPFPVTFDPAILLGRRSR